MKSIVICCIILAASILVFADEDAKKTEKRGVFGLGYGGYSGYHGGLGYPGYLGGYGSYGGYGGHGYHGFGYGHGYPLAAHAPLVHHSSYPVAHASYAAPLGFHGYGGYLH